MRIESLRLHRISMPLVRPFETSFGRQSVRDVLLVQIETDARGVSPASVSIAPAAPAGLRTDELRKLQAALDELGECRRMIDTALQSDAA